VRCEKPAARSGTSLRASASTAYGTTSPVGYSPDGIDVKAVQARLRHASAKTTLGTYGHIWPDRDESTRAAVNAVLTAYLTEQRRNSATAEP
jgi:integrase